jgi:diguanylate cyclase (GGDEF)-like protein/PAS domain S-box-containing protein
MKTRADATVVLAGALATVIGGLATLGYAFGVAALIQPLRGVTSMVLSVAFCITAGGAALILEGRGAAFRKPLVALGALMAATGVIAGLERWFGGNLGIDFPALHRSLGTGSTAPGRPSLVCCACLLLLGAAIAGLPFAAKRRITFALAALATLGGALGATSLAGYLLSVEFLISWPSSTPLPPQAALAFTLLGFALWRALLLRAREQAADDPIDEGRRIHLTAIWVLSLIAVVAGVATFALAQYEYQNVVHGNLERSLRERRAFLEYAIREHVQQVSMAANRPMLVQLVTSARSAREVAKARDALSVSAEMLTKNDFSGWRYEIDGYAPISAGSFIRNPALAVPLVGPYSTELIFDNGYFLRTRMPIRNETGPVGFAVAEDPLPELARLQLQADSWGETGTMALCAAEGDGLQCFPLRSNPKPSHITREVNGRALPMSHALDFETGVVESLDYLNHRVMAAYGPVGFTGLGMVIKIDAAELNQPLGNRFGYAMLLLFALVVAGVFLMRRQLTPLTDALKKSREEAARVAQQFKAAAESSLDAYFIMSAVRDSRNAVVDFRIDYKNASGEVLTGRASEEVIGKKLSEILPPKHAGFFIDRYRRIVATGESLSEEFRTSGGLAATWVAHQAVKLGDGVSVTGRDITQRKLVEAQLRNRAENDVLTGLPNRTLFFERLEHALSKARKDRSSVAVLFLDVDHFKQVNDTHGHAAGDAVLIEFAHRLRNSVRAPDIVARLSGDEFAIMIGELDDIGQVEHIAAHIVDALTAPFEFEDKRLSISASIGIGFSAQGLESAQSLVARADRKLYQAKAAGRGRFSSTAEPNAA